MPEGQLEFVLAGEPLLALSEGALFWPAGRTLFVADVHFGKDATFRHALRWVPPGTTQDDTRRLDELIARHEAKQLVILGDTFHSRHAGEDQTAGELRRWRDRVAASVLLVKGNHDRRAAELATELRLDVVEEGHRLGPFALHHNPVEDGREEYILCGHIHPVVVARGLARQRLRIRCFWVQPHQCVLPAFGGFTGGFEITPTAQDRVIVIAGERVLEIATRVSR